jgi:transposase
MINSVKLEPEYPRSWWLKKCREVGLPEEEVSRVATATEPKPILVLEAVKRYGIPRSTIYEWVQSGKLRVLGRERAWTRGGGYLILDEVQIQFLVDHRPQRTGRPLGSRDSRPRKYSKISEN